MPVSAIAEWVFARSDSGDTVTRGALAGPERTVEAADRQRLFDDVRPALWSSKVVVDAQELEQIRKASEQ